MTKHEILIILKELYEKLEMSEEDYIKMRKEDEYPLELRKEDVYPAKAGIASGVIKVILEIEGIEMEGIDEKY